MEWISVFIRKCAHIEITRKTTTQHYALKYACAVMVIGALLSAPSQPYAQTTLLTTEFTENIKAIDTQLSAVSKAAKNVVTTLSAEFHQAADLQSEIGNNPDDLLAWVQNSIRTVPYKGALKGAQGVLLARQGNTLDQTLLLHRLFVAAGIESRMVQSTIDPDGLNTVFQQQIEQNDPALAKWSADYSTYLSKHRGLFSSLVSDASERLHTQGDALNRVIDSTRPLFDDQLTKLNALLPELNSPVSASQIDSIFEDAFQQQYWLQAKSPDGHWIDYSVTFGSRIPESLTSRASTIDPDNLPSEILHRVRLQIEIDLANEKDTSPVTKSVFDYTIAPHALPSTSMVLQLQPSGASSATEVASAAAVDVPLAEVLSAEFDNHNAWVPTLVLDRDTLLRQNGFTANGDVFEFSSEQLGGLDKTTKNQLEGAIDALQLKKQTTDASQSRVVAVRQVWTIISPGAEPKRVERSLYSADHTPSLGNVPVSHSLSQAMTRQSEVFIQTGMVPWHYVEQRVAEDYLQHYFGLRYLFGKLAKATSTDVDFPAIAEKMLSRLILPAEMLILAAIRTEGMQDGYLQEPNVLTSIQNLHISEDGSKAILNDAIDIVHSHSTYSTSDATTRRLSSGIWDNIAELALRGPASVMHNAAKAFSAVQADDISLIKTTAELTALSVDSTQRNIMTMELQQGYWLAAADNNALVRKNWWRINPTTGNTIGQSMGAYDVGGAAISETTILLVRFQMAVLGYMLDMAKCSNANRGNSQKALNCAICASVGHSLKTLSMLKVGGEAMAGAAGDASGLTGQVCSIVNR